MMVWDFRLNRWREVHSDDTWRRWRAISAASAAWDRCVRRREDAALRRLQDRFDIVTAVTAFVWMVAIVRYLTFVAWVRHV